MLSTSVSEDTGASETFVKTRFMLLQIDPTCREMFEAMKVIAVEAIYNTPLP